MKKVKPIRTIPPEYMESLIDECNVLSILASVENTMLYLTTDHKLYSAVAKGRDHLITATERLNKKNACWPVC